MSAEEHSQSPSDEISDTVTTAPVVTVNGAVDITVNGVRCPVTPLGRLGDVHFFLSPSGNLVKRKPREFSRNELVSLFDGDTGWIFAAFPKQDKDGNSVDWNINKVSAWLILKCAESGFFDPEKQVRGSGVWRAQKVTGEIDPRLLVHAGNELSTDGGKTWTQSGVKVGRHVYVAGLPEPKPLLGRSADQVAGLLDLLRRWNWRSDLSADLLLGWIGAAMIAGALPWRPIIWVTGQAGTGKSTLERLLDKLFEGLSLRAADPSSAGLRQTLKGSARVVMLDEIEAAAHNTRARDIVELARMGSTAGQAPVLRGSADGSAQSYPIEAIFYLTSIVPPPLEHQDATRISILDLDPLVSDARSRMQVSRDLRECGKLGPLLRGRMLDGIDRYSKNFEIWESALAAIGRDSRSIDQLATLLAARDTLAHDTQTSPAEAAEYLAMVEEALESDDRVSDSEKCLNHLLTSTSSYIAGGRYLAIGEVIAIAISNTGDTHGAASALNAHGISAEYYGGSAYLTIANQHRSLLRIFDQTQWSGGAWKTSLKRLPHAKSSGPKRYSGALARGVEFPTEIKVETLADTEKPPDTDGF